MRRERKLGDFFFRRGWGGESEYCELIHHQNMKQAKHLSSLFVDKHERRNIGEHRRLACMKTDESTG